MHKEMVRTFRCGMCNPPFKTENTQINHEKTCGGARAEREEKRKCEKYGKDYSKNNIARHRRACTAREGEGGVRGAVRPGGAEEEEEPRARVYRAKWSRCPECGQMKSATNMARHRRTCRGGDELWWRDMSREWRTSEKERNLLCRVSRAQTTENQLAGLFKGPLLEADNDVTSNEGGMQRS